MAKKIEFKVIVIDKNKYRIYKGDKSYRQKKYFYIELIYNY